MQVQLKNWGNSLGIRIPKEILREAGIKNTDSLNIYVDGEQIILEKKFVHRTLEERAAAYGGKLNLSPAIDWGEPKGNEVW